MPRKSIVLGASALLLAGLLPAITPASAETRPRDEERFVDLTTLPVNQVLRPVEPNSVTSGPNGTRIEVYGSVGDNEGGMDWRTINAFSRLVSSVPKGKHSYTTLFNSLYDERGVGYSGGKFTVASPQEVFAPTAAYLIAANRYDTEAERKQFIHVLGAKESMDEAYAARSSLARLMKMSPEAADYRQCPGEGGCLSGPTHLMHSKYGAFEQAVDSSGELRNHVIWITSSNLNGSSGSKKSNISIAIYNDEKAYTAITEGIYKPSIEVSGSNGKSATEAIDDSPMYKDAISLVNGVMKGMATDSGVTLLPSPRRRTSASNYTASTDVEAAFLNQQAANNVAKPGCKVYAVHSLFNSTRNGVVDGLDALHNQQCDVRIVLGDNAISDLVDGYFNMSSKLRELIGRVEFANVHDKTLSYKHGGTATTFGGASNFTGTSLEYDELAFRADNAGVTDSVQEHSERIYQLAKGQTTWATPKSVSISPASSTSKRLKVETNKSLQVSHRLSPENALVTSTTWESDNPAVATVSPSGVITGRLPGTATIRVRATAPRVEGKEPLVKTGHAYVTVGGTGSGTSEGAGGRASIAPTLTMDNYQSPGGNTDIVVTWGAGGKEYDGVVKLQYYSSGWRTYPTYVTVKNGVGRLSRSFGSSKTWRAYGARLDRIDGKAVPNSTSKLMSKWSINTVRTRSASLTPRIYATSMAKSGSKVPFLLSWKRNGGKVRLQMRSSGGSWKTHSIYTIHGDQEFVVVPVLNTKYWRIATSTGSTKVSNSVKVSMK